MRTGCLANDLMIFYAPSELYEDGGMTVMEMICASPCITSMICFSLEVKYGNMFNAQMHMQRHRVGARGNATTFPLPWQAVLAELQRLDEEGEEGVSPRLPRTGEDLKYVVQVLLKTSDEEKRDNLKHFIHQAHVNRTKVVRCILRMKARGHRAFANIDAEDVAARARALPENGVPPELLHLLPNDNTLDKIQVQKAATPVEALRSDLTQGKPSGQRTKTECNGVGAVQQRRRRHQRSTN